MTMSLVLQRPKPLWARHIEIYVDARILDYAQATAPDIHLATFVAAAVSKTLKLVKRKCIGRLRSVHIRLQVPERPPGMQLSLTGAITRPCETPGSFTVDVNPVVFDYNLFFTLAHECIHIAQCLVIPMEQWSAWAFMYFEVQAYFLAQDINRRAQNVASQLWKCTGRTMYKLFRRTGRANARKYLRDVQDPAHHDHHIYSIYQEEAS